MYVPAVLAYSTKVNGYSNTYHDIINNKNIPCGFHGFNAINKNVSYMFAILLCSFPCNLYLAKTFLLQKF